MRTKIIFPLLFFICSLSAQQIVPVQINSSTNVLYRPTAANFRTANALPATSGTLAQFAATTSAQLAGVLSDETGTGALVFAGGNIGAATATSITGATTLSLAGGSSGASLSLGSGATGGATIPGVVSSSAATLTIGSATTQGYGLVFKRYNPVAGWETATIIDSGGSIKTNASLLVSGTGAMDYPNAEAPMVGIKSDVVAASLLVMTGPSAGATTGSYIFGGLDTSANYRFLIEGTGDLKWGVGTRAGLDTNLYRQNVGALRTDGNFEVGTAFSVVGNSTFTGTIAANGQVTRTGTTGTGLKISMSANASHLELAVGGTTKWTQYVTNNSDSLALYSAALLAVEVSQTGNMTLSGAYIGSVDALSGTGAVSVTKETTALTTTGSAQALTLANGTNGQTKIIIHDVDGGSAVLTPTTKTGFSTVTFTNAGDTVTLKYRTTRGWFVVGSYGATIAP